MLSQNVIDLLDKIGFSKADAAVMNAAYDALCGNAAWEKVIAASPLERETDVKALIPLQQTAAQETGTPLTTVQLLYLVCYLPELCAAYAARGYDEVLFVEAARDLTFKKDECMTMENHCGTRSFEWHVPFYRFDRFALGRLQYEDRIFPCEDYACHGVTVKKGEKILGMHIPGGSPLTREKCLDSLKKAFAFYGCTKEKPLIVHCHSWLLSPDHRAMLNGKGGIVDFIDMFDFLAAHEAETFADAWRVFGSAVDGPVETWPQDSRLRKGYVDLLLAGKKSHRGEGLLIFDGEKLLTGKAE